MAQCADFDCLIIGGGPAGLTAALYLARYRHKVALVDGGSSRAALIPLTRNYPGFPEGLAGKELLERLRRQAGLYGVQPIQGWVEALQRSGEGFVASMGQDRLGANKVLLASGIADAVPSMADWEAAVQCGCLRLCPVCDAYEVIDRRVAVVLSSKDRIRHVLFLRTYTTDLTLLAADEAIRLSNEEREALQRAGVRVVEDPIAEMRATPSGKALVRTRNGEQYCFDSVYPMLGAVARSELATRLGARCNDEGDLWVDRHQRTSVPGLYAAGDVVNALNQIAVAVGHAAVAATDIHNNLLGELR